MHKFYEMTAASFSGVQVTSFNGEGFQDRLADFYGFNFASNHEAGFVSSSFNSTAGATINDIDTLF